MNKTKTARLKQETGSLKPKSARFASQPETLKAPKQLQSTSRQKKNHSSRVASRAAGR
jgi:hypothetical protein